MKHASIALQGVLGAALVLASTAGIAADPYPNRPIKFVVPFAAGGSADPQFRLVAESMRDTLGQPVVIDNKPGALSTIGLRYLSEAAPDGYTIGMVTISAAILYATMPTYKVDPVNGFTFISQYNYGDYAIVVNNKVPVNNMKELVEYAKRNPDKFNIAVGGASLDMAMIAFAERAGVKLQTVKYKGQAPVRTAVVGGETQAGLDVPGFSKQFADQGRWKFIAVTGDKRNDMAPGVPTVAESGFPGFEAGFWWAIGGPTAMPADIVAKLNAAARKAIASPAVKTLMAQDGQRPVPSSPEQLKQLMVAETKRWGDIARQHNIVQED